MTSPAVNGRSGITPGRGAWPWPRFGGAGTAPNPELTPPMVARRPRRSTARRARGANTHRRAGGMTPWSHERASASGSWALGADAEAKRGERPMRARVLVVDDDPALAEMLTIVLRNEGFDTAVVRDGAKAVEAFRESHPDLILLDLMLPGTSGLDVCKEIRAESGVPIIMLTAK